MLKFLDWKIFGLVFNKSILIYLNLIKKTWFLNKIYVFEY